MTVSYRASEQEDAMPKGKNQKLKLYYLSRIMLEKTDEDHELTMPQMISRKGSLKWAICTPQSVLLDRENTGKKIFTHRNDTTGERIKRAETGEIMAK